MKFASLLLSLALADRLDRKEINIDALDSEWALEDDEDIDELGGMDPRRNKGGIDPSKLDGRDHTTTWSETKKGQRVSLYVTPVEGLSQVV